MSVTEDPKAKTKMEGIDTRVIVSFIRISLHSGKRENEFRRLPKSRVKSFSEILLGVPKFRPKDSGETRVLERKLRFTESETRKSFLLIRVRGKSTKRSR